MPDLRYPIGRFDPRPSLTPSEREAEISRIATLPDRLARAVDDLDDAQLDTPYRPEGWTVRQVVHHLPDSHLNGFLRVKLGLTEDSPPIPVYDQDRFAELGDVARTPPEISLGLLRALHARWVELFRTLDDADWERTVTHPEAGPMRLETLLQLYAWHGDHHLGHVRGAREREGW